MNAQLLKHNSTNSASRIASAIVFSEPQQVALTSLVLDQPVEGDVLVDMLYSGISTGTERLLWDGTMPAFPGMGYPLVPGYESVGVVSEVFGATNLHRGDKVFVPGARCYGQVKGLFGGSSSAAVVQASRLVHLTEQTLAHVSESQATLLALAATAHHMLVVGQLSRPSAVDTQSQLIIGHGVLGRLLARIMVAKEMAPPVVWEESSARASGAIGYAVTKAANDSRHDYQKVWDVSGDAGLLNQLIARVSPGGIIVLGGFYNRPLSFDFAPAFMREVQIRVAAQWTPADLCAVVELIGQARLSLDQLITHDSVPNKSTAAYKTAFGDADCLKMILDWRAAA